MSTHPLPAAPTVPTISADIVGHETQPQPASIDARWLMAYAAATGARHSRFFDTTATRGPAAHPLFAVCYEWPVMLELRAQVIPEAAAPFGVHASHRLIWRRIPRVGDQLSTWARVTRLAARRSGTLMVARLMTVDQRGDPVSETDYGSLFRSVALEGGESAVATVPSQESEAGAVRWSESIDVPAEAAHVYSECARIWNPIHTDLAVARAAGLPGPILHGTATLALAVSCVMARELASEPSLVWGIGGRFTGMVALPSTIVVRARARRRDGLDFDVVTTAGLPLISEGVLHL